MAWNSFNPIVQMLGWPQRDACAAELQWGSARPVELHPLWALLAAPQGAAGLDWASAPRTEPEGSMPLTVLSPTPCRSFDTGWWTCSGNFIWEVHGADSQVAMILCVILRAIGTMSELQPGWEAVVARQAAHSLKPFNCVSNTLF